MKDKNKKRELCHHSFFTSHYNRIKNLLPSQLTIQLKLMLHNFSAKTFRAILLNYPNRSIRMVLSSLLSNFRLIFFLCDTLVEFDKKITSFWFVFFFFVVWMLVKTYLNRHSKNFGVHRRIFLNFCFGIDFHIAQCPYVSCT